MPGQRAFCFARGHNSAETHRRALLVSNTDRGLAAAYRRCGRRLRLQPTRHSPRPRRRPHGLWRGLHTWQRNSIQRPEVCGGADSGDAGGCAAAAARCARLSCASRRRRMGAQAAAGAAFAEVRAARANTRRQLPRFHRGRRQSGREGRAAAAALAAPGLGQSLHALETRARALDRRRRLAHDGKRCRRADRGGRGGRVGRSCNTSSTASHATRPAAFAFSAVSGRAHVKHGNAVGHHRTD